MKLLTQDVKFDRDLIVKYDRPTARYTSYPTAHALSSEFTEPRLYDCIARSNQKKSPLSLYFHIPFCQSACYFCGCNVIVTQTQKAIEPYLNYLSKNIANVSELIDKDRKVSQLHWGGGTPNYLSLAQVEALWNKIHQHFTFEENAEISIEVNPRYVDRNYIFLLGELGFNRISFGIQDFNPQVQAAVNRVQPEELLFNVMGWIREAGFESANVDLIYGLPFQNLSTFTETIEKTIKLDPERVAVFNFAYLPSMKPVQKNIAEKDLPQAEEKLAILQMAIEKLTSNGYVFIGMDHFAKPTNELAIAQREGNLHRNFQGYTTLPDADLFGFGITSISMLDDVYFQNHKRLKDYYQAIDAGNLPVEKAVFLDSDDMLRREVIMELMCQFNLSKRQIEAKYNIDFERYFAGEQEHLQALEKDGLVQVDAEQIQVTPVGRLLIRNIATVFDAYSRKNNVRMLSRSI